MQYRFRGLLTLALIVVTTTVAYAQTNERTLARVFWQDGSDQSLKSGDLKRGKAWSIQPTSVAGFPKLDPEKQLHVVSLDLNRDGNFSDASVRTSLTVGRSLIEGHSGHHEAAAIGRAMVAISNPGDGSIAIISTSDWTVQTTLKVGGTPTRILAVGG